MVLEKALASRCGLVPERASASRPMGGGVVRVSEYTLAPGGAKESIGIQVWVGARESIGIQAQGGLSKCLGTLGWPAHLATRPGGGMGLSECLSTLGWLVHPASGPGGRMGLSKCLNTLGRLVHPATWPGGRVAGVIRVGVFALTAGRYWFFLCMWRCVCLSWGGSWEDLWFLDC